MQTLIPNKERVSVMEMYPEIEIKEIQGRKELKKFIAFQNELYKDCPYYVPCLQFDELDLLDSNKNPAYKYCEAKFFMAFIDGKAVGRICGLLNREYNRCWDRKCVRFTRFDYIDDIRVSSKLMAYVENWALSIGMQEVQGPMGFCDLDKEGMLVEGFDDQNMFFTIYNFPYYVEHMQKLGYEKSVDWIEYNITVPEELDERIYKIADMTMEKNELHVAKIKRSRDLLKYRHEIFRLLHEAYKNLYGVVPLNDEQIELYTSQFITMIHPEFISLILDKNEKLISFGIVVPSMNEAAIKSKGKLFPFGFIHLLKALKCKHTEVLNFLLVAVDPKYQGRGINAKLLTEMFRGAKKFGVKSCETGPMLEENNKIHLMWKHFEHRQHKRRRCYIRRLV